jgi:hypothetical protein
VWASPLETLEREDIQASAAARTALAPLLHPWKGSSAAVAIEFHASGQRESGLLLFVQPGSEAAVGEGARRLLHSSRGSGLDLRSRSSSISIATG